MANYDWANLTPLGRQLAIAAGADPNDGYMTSAGAGYAPGYFDNNYGALTTGGQYTFAKNNLTNWSPQVLQNNASPETGYDYTNTGWSRFMDANGKPMAAFKDADGIRVFPDPGDFGGTGFSGQKLGKMAGVKYDRYDAAGNYLGNGTFDAKDGWRDENIGDALGVGSIFAMAAGGALAAGAGGAGAAGAAEGAGAVAAGGAGASEAAAAAAAASAGGTAGTAGMLDLGGGLFMTADGAIVGATPGIASTLTNAGIMESVGGLGGIGGGTGALGAGGSAVFNPAVDSQLASTQLGITGGQAAADAAAAGIPSVTVNGAPTGSFLSNLTASGGGASGVGNVSGGTLGQLGSAATSVLGNGSGTGALGGWGSLITPALQLIGGAYQASQAGNASDAMIAANDRGIAENRRQFDTVRGLLQPYVDAGTGALGAYQNLAGLKGNDVQQGEINNLTNSAQFGSLAHQGEDAILQNASATGGLRGGNTQNGLANFRSNLLTSLIDKQLGRYGSLVDVGQRSAAGTGSAALTTGTANAALMQQQGAAQAGGIVSGTNAITNALGGIGGYFAGQQAVAPQVPQVSQFGTGVAAPGQVRF